MWKVLHFLENNPRRIQNDNASSLLTTSSPTDAIFITTPGSDNVWRPEAIDPHTQQVTLSNRWRFAQPDPRLSLYANANLLTFSRTRTLGCLHSFYTMLHHSNRWDICPDRNDLAPGLALCEQKDYGCLSLYKDIYFHFTTVLLVLMKKYRGNNSKHIAYCCQ